MDAVSHLVLRAHPRTQLTLRSGAEFDKKKTSDDGSNKYAVELYERMSQKRHFIELKLHTLSEILGFELSSWTKCLNSSNEKFQYSIYNFKMDFKWMQGTRIFRENIFIVVMKLLF